MFKFITMFTVLWFSCSSFAATSDVAVSSPMNNIVIITLISLIPIFFVAMTTFTRNIIVLGMVRHGLGLPQTPPNIVLILIAIFLTLLVMGKHLDQSYQTGIKPYINQEISLQEGAERAWKPISEFMITQTHEKDIQFIYELSQKPLPKTPQDLRPVELTAAFMLSELKTAFQIGFLILLPFLIIDLIIASILMSLGMIMVPPATISLPIKILLFIMIDGWGLLMQTLVNSTH